MNDEKLNSSPKLSIVDCQLSIAKREIFRFVKTRSTSFVC